MKNIIKSILIFCTLIVGVTVFAQMNPVDLKFPIPELGNCGSVDECKTFCDISSNQDVCFQWAKDNGFISDKPEIHEDFVGPGGCTSEEECEAYCDNKEHGEECLDFAVSEGYMTAEEAERSRADMNRTGPGGCTNREECDAFCRNPDNTKICLQSAVDSGMMTQEEADFLAEREEFHKKRKIDDGGRGGPGRPDGPGGPEIDEEKAMEILKTIGGPGGCGTFDECDRYCSTPENEEKCMEFALGHGLIPQEEVEKFKKLKEMGGPGGCKGRVECDAFCSKPDNQEVCLNFAIKNDLMSPEELKHIKKMMEIEKLGGPGGCKGKEECDAYCGDPEHGEECFSFAKQHGLMSEEELKITEKEMEIYRRLDKGEMGGPGGCMGREECDSYCRDENNLEECMNFAGDQDMADRARMEHRMMQYKQMEQMTREFHQFMPQEDMMVLPKESENKKKEEEGEYTETRDRMMYPPKDFDTSKPFPMPEPYPMPGVDKCDFNEDGFVDKEEGMKCMEETTRSVPPENFEPPKEFAPFDGNYESFKKTDNYYQPGTAPEQKPEYRPEHNEDKEQETTPHYEGVMHSPENFESMIPPEGILEVMKTIESVIQHNGATGFPEEKKN